MRPTTLGGFELDRFEHLGDGVLAVVTTRHGGHSTGPYATLNLGDHVGDDPDAVRANRDLVAAALGVEALTVADQVHGRRVAVVDRHHAGAGHDGLAAQQAMLPGTDALVTDLPGVALATLVADCQPVVLHDPVRRVLGVAHAGRPGTVDGIVPATVGRMVERWGTDPAELRVGIGPHVCAPSYEVGPHEAGAFRAAFPDLPDAVVPTADGRATVDIEAGARHQLRRLGVPDDAVETAGVDTPQRTDRWFSDRAERPCGRFALVAVLRP